MKKSIMYLFLIVSLLSASCMLYRGNKMATRAQQLHYGIVGCSAGGFYAATELLKLDAASKITCISEEKAEPYNKTSLKSVVSGKKEGTRISLASREKGDYSRIDFRLGAKVTSIQRQDKIVTLADASIIPYDKLLIATGAKPLVPTHLRHALSWDNVLVYNSQQDTSSIIERVGEQANARVLIVGAGIRSLELADALMKRNPGMSVSIANRSVHFLGASSDDVADSIIQKRVELHGVNFIAPATVDTIKKHDQSNLGVELSTGSVLKVDLIVFALGTQPNSALAGSANILLFANGAIKVDDELKTSDPNIFAAGDVIAFADPLNDKVLRSSKWSAAREQGRIAARNMAGAHERYKHVPAAHISSFFGLKAFISGEVRYAQEASLPAHSYTSENHYVRFIIKEERLKAFVMLWDKQQKSPNILFVRKKLLDQSPLHNEDLNKKVYSGLS